MRNKVSDPKDQPFARPTRNLRLLELSKINSYLPDKDVFCLQPIRKPVEPAPTPKPKSKLIKPSAECQTEPL